MRLAPALLASTLSFAVVGGAHAATRNSEYRCAPAWDDGDTLIIDWVKLHVQFPNGSEMDMTDFNEPSGFRIGEADVEISGRDTDRITVTEGGEPTRTCRPR